MTSLFVEFRNTLEAEFLKLKPELEKVATLLENVQKELRPMEGAALQAIVGAGIAAAATAIPGGAFTLSAAETAVVIGARAAATAAVKQGITLSEQGALALASVAGVPVPPTANGVNG